MLKKNLIPLKTKQIYLKSKTDKKKDWNKIIKVMKATDLNVLKKNKVQNKISKNIINIEIKTTKKIILKSIREIKLFIKSIGNIVKNPTYKTIKENRLYIKAVKKTEQKPEIILEKRKENKLFIKGFKKEKNEKQEWNKLNELKKQNSLKLIGKKIKELKLKIIKNSNINYIHKTKKVILKKQSLYSFNIQRTEQLEKTENEEFEVINNWSNLLKAQRSTKFFIKGKIKNIKFVISKINKFMIKKEPEEDIIYNDDYNSIIQNKKEKVNEKNLKSKNDKILVIKEKEITPILKREIRAQVIKVKEDSSETSEQSEIDILEGINIQRMMTLTKKRENSMAGFKKKLINGEVIFTPKGNLSLNLGGAKFKKEIFVKKGIKYHKQKSRELSGIEISGNNSDFHYEKINGSYGFIKKGNNEIIKYNNDFMNEDLNAQKKLNTIYKSSCNIRENNILSKLPIDTNKKQIKKQIIIESKLNKKIGNQTLNNERFFLNGNIYE